MRKGEETRQTILDEAVRIASTAGLDGLTIGSLATQTKLSKSGLFAHFRSKESLQLQVLDHAATRFLNVVALPTLAAPRGEPRVRELFERWMEWAGEILPGGCLFITAGVEFDDRPGPMRDYLVRQQRDWLETIAQVVRTAVAEGDFDPDLDAEQFAHDLYGVILAYHHTKRLLHDPAAESRAHRAFGGLLAAAREPGR
ncbi:TetR/AcrR family transcriptional regulator [Solihabitans fulvus]|uniref:TetR/AcrR family transcriptional regulator n=1 Tax=Solihabitans fulvus TaxID=1892852 RepID=A0A5B2WLQ2_9PSEU|nr:TetR/AcrR family transcriptional regulator [Solihabitans fulvus]KAA2250957.1 TetR/AcrR family transcriptional regulator [Solihabitans fulvus]